MWKEEKTSQQKPKCPGAFETANKMLPTAKQDDGDAYVVYGLTTSYFTRKLTSYLWYKCLPYRIKLDPGRASIARFKAHAYPGGIPCVYCSDTQEPMWDTTAMILHLEHKHQHVRSVMPSHSDAMQFLNFLIEDYSDEWIPRLAAGTRWNFEEVRGFVK